MKLRNLSLYFLLLAVIIVACSPDDPDFIPVEDRDRTEQQTTDKALILEYLQTHFYNSGELAGLVNPEVEDIIIDTLLTTVPANHTLLIDAVETRTTTFEDTVYEYYILKINQGGGEESPNFTDAVRVEYEGRLIPNFEDEIDTNDEDSVFDSAVTPADFNLVGFGVNGGGVITGWQRVFPEFNTAESFTTGPTVEYNNYGFGIMFLPSGLAYFSTQLLGIPSYSNLMFKFTLFQSQVVDHDEDGIPSYVEDLNGDLSTFDEDTDEDNIVNYVDPDDDGDGVLTINELMRTEYIFNVGDSDPILATNEFELTRTVDMGVVTLTTGTIVDTDMNGEPDYLDEDITEDYSEDN
ncbi:MAG: hypothetical protein ED556_13690 [Winogradskyella sp.]|uniref:FKBP-type peptidyl-prolyl cis-trans isomerase n=1 Tax=Winogradskyella sp. TaxID=1883156 RepID=UPI000F3F2DA3|nr:hypothetical protein [Winogradskyella sp.]RNC80158.1 MAG: hypothetical protein ED556_13690 [Winogradskyella sp.]